MFPAPFQLLLLILLSGEPAPSPDQTVPETVTVDLQVLHISDISEKDQTFNAVVYLWVTWRKGAPQPELELVNATELTVQKDFLEEDEDTVRLTQRLYGSFYTSFHLSRFPFDEQILSIVLEDFRRDDRQLVLMPVARDPDLPVEKELGDWSLESASYRQTRTEIHTIAGETRGFSRLTCDLHLKRRSAFYVNRFFLPLILLVGCSFMTFYLRLDQFDSLIQIGTAGMLSIIALAFSINDYLPRVSYVVLIDRIFIVCYCSIFLSLVLAIRCNYLNNHHQIEAAERLLALARWLFPLVLIAATALCFI